MRQTVNQDYHMEMLKQLYAAVLRKRPELVAQWLDSPPWHCSSSQGTVKQFLAQKSITKMEHPPYSPDLVPHDIWLFSKVKSALNVWRFQDTEDIQKKKCDGTESYSTICVMMSKLFLHKQRTGLAIKLLW